MSDTIETTIDEMKAALEAAGQKPHHKTGDEKIRELYAELTAEPESEEDSAEPEPEETVKALELTNHTGAAEIANFKEQHPDGVMIPPRPECDPILGDKTPAVVAWYREYKPTEYKARYAGRVVDGVTL